MKPFEKKMLEKRRSWEQFSLVVSADPLFVFVFVFVFLYLIMNIEVFISAGPGTPLAEAIKVRSTHADYQTRLRPVFVDAFTFWFVFVFVFTHTEIPTKTSEFCCYCCWYKYIMLPYS